VEVANGLECGDPIVVKLALGDASKPEYGDAPNVVKLAPGDASKPEYGDAPNVVKLALGDVSELENGDAPNVVKLALGDASEPEYGDAPNAPVVAALDKVALRRMSSSVTGRTFRGTVVCLFLFLFFLSFIASSRTGSI